MKPFFVLLGILLAIYIAVAVHRGEVIARSGPGMRRIRRDETAGYFWAVIAIYACLSLALLFLF